MSTANVTENIVALEPVSRDDFADSPAPAPAESSACASTGSSPQRAARPSERLTYRGRR